MRHPHFRDIIEQWISPEETDRFAAWGWGENFKELHLTGLQVLEIWNKRHGDLYLLHKDNSVFADIPKMIEIWKENA